MKFSGIGIDDKSHIYFYTPSQTAKKLLYYPIAAGSFHCNSDYRVERKNYDSILALYVVNGNLTLIQNGEKTKAEKDTLLLIDCYEPHEYFADSFAQTLWVHFDGGESRIWFDEIKLKKGQKIKTGGSCADLLMRIIDSIKNAENECVVSNRIYSLLCHILSTSEQNIQNDTLKSVTDAKKYIKENLEKDLSVEIIAKSAHLSASYFSKTFKESTGLSPYDYLLNLRLEKAKELLLQTDFSVSEIAYKTGFNSAANFIYFFKKETNITPLKFRKMKF